jgi:hypothetical protein
MKFELDHRTGMMRPKKDEEIYFAQSQGGGLIVDDKKNNIKYIIERDGRITKLFGSFDKDNLNLYDMRDARIIADRVRRLLGVDHKYTDFHYFLRGYHMSESFIKTCSDFLGESIWSDIQDRSGGETIKKEEGRIIGSLEDGTKLIMPNDAWADGGKIVEFDEGNIYTFDESGDKIYVAVMENPQYRDVYYRYDEDSEDVVNMISCFETDDDLRKSNEFGVLKAMMRQDEWDNDDFDYLEVEVLRDFVKIKVEKSYEFAIYEDRDKAIDNAIDWEKDLLESDNLTKDVVKRFRNVLGDDFFDEKSMKSELKDSMETYYNDLEEDDAIEELLRYNIIEDTEDYFGLDEDGDIDHSIQKFDYQDYGDAYAEKYVENIGDVIDEFISNFGYDGIEDFIKYDRLAQLIIEADGPESAIARYDSVEREETVNGQTYYIYRVD